MGVLTTENTVIYKEKCKDALKEMRSLSDKFFNFNFNKRLLGVDITPNCIYICQIDSQKGRNILKNLDSVCIKGKFVKDDILCNKELYVDGLKTLIKRNKFTTKDVALSIPVSCSIIKTVTVPKMSDSQLEYQLKEGNLWNDYVDNQSLQDDYSVFYEITRRNLKNPTMDVVFIASKLSDIKLFKEIIEESGLKPSIIDVRCITIANEMRRHQDIEKNAEIAFLEVGIEDNYLMIMGNRRPLIKSVYISPNEREALLAGVYEHNIVEGFIHRIARQIDKLVEAHNNEHPRSIIKNIKITSSLPIIHEITSGLIALLPQYDIAECNFLPSLDIGDNFMISSENAANSFSSWASSVSMAKRGIKTKITSIEKTTLIIPNLILDYNRKLRAKFVGMIQDKIIYFANNIYNFVMALRWESLKLTQAKLIVSAYSIAIILMYTSYNSIKDDNEYKEQMILALSDLGELYGEKANNLASLEGFIAKFDDLRSFMDKHPSNQGDLIKMYSNLNNVMQDGVWLDEVNFEAPDRISFTGKSIDDKGVIEFSNTLDKSTDFSRVYLRGIREIREISWDSVDAVTFKRFDLDAKLDNVVPTIDDNSKKMIAGEDSRGG